MFFGDNSCEKCWMKLFVYKHYITVKGSFIEPG